MAFDLVRWKVSVFRCGPVPSLAVWAHRPDARLYADSANESRDTERGKDHRRTRGTARSLDKWGSRCARNFSGWTLHSVRAPNSGRNGVLQGTRFRPKDSTLAPGLTNR